jgi:hypothetical protein
MINCRRVGVLTKAIELFLSFIIFLRSFCATATHLTTPSKYVQDNLFVDMDLDLGGWSKPGKSKNGKSKATAAD